MTVGQRIAQKRKELGLSQENLGDRMDVSRQAIYKWESDQALPEIDKLVTLSRLFSVTVGWLLGVEEDAAPESGELTEAQLKMVREIADRYIAAIPVPEAPEPPPPPRRRRWPYALAGLAIVLVFWFFSGRLGNLQDQYYALNSSLSSLQASMFSVSDQIGSITGQVQSILERQASLLADWSCVQGDMDIPGGTVAFSVRAVPKTYEEGMTAVFTVESGGEALEFPAEAGADHAFALEAVCPLTDDIQISVALVTPDGRRQTQLLEAYQGLYSDTFPFVYIPFSLASYDIEGDTLRAEQLDYMLWDSEGNAVDIAGRPIDTEQISQLRMGLFKDSELVTWYEPVTVPIILNGSPAEKQCFQRPELTLERGHFYQEAVVVTDQYGREMVYSQGGVTYGEAAGEWVNTAFADGTHRDPGEWSY